MTASITTGDGLKAIATSKTPGRPRSTVLRDIKERFIVSLLVLCGAITISITVLIVFILAQQAAGFFGGGIQDVQGREANVTISEFLTGLEWNPLQGSDKEFGIWPLITGTFQVTIVAMCIAIPVGLMVAIWLSEFASPKVRSVIKPLIEIIAGVPTVVFGYFALTFVTPLLQLDFAGIAGNPDPNKANPLNIQIFNVLAAGLTVGIMCIPIVTSLSEDALRAVPRALREGSYGLGASRFETSVKVVFPAALSGIVAACLLAFARAVGETMIVAIAAGLNPPDLAAGLGKIFAVNEPTQTMTGYMVSVFFGDLATGTVEYQSVYAVGMTLFLITLIITIVGAYIRKRFRQQYE
ncbi:phosphate ABC transporter permease subunit PstC [Algisphaera agarilytica]|uniref:Phosphate transport system permease protein n=1 Tax=Algisphaera agarilytica TaxID=1385975 RepID=A0A7X0H7H0_9BACT|nr:phosphate ABC transporter permease subunit PstC [Algisphaera agarilytica]MBB6430654.1 phosphate transport system permease protein [Algisphaera agarilytica]